MFGGLKAITRVLDWFANDGIFDRKICANWISQAPVTICEHPRKSRFLTFDRLIKVATSGNKLNMRNS